MATDIAINTSEQAKKIEILENALEIVSKTSGYFVSELKINTIYLQKVLIESLNNKIAEEKQELKIMVNS